MAIPTYDWSEPAIVRLVEYQHVPDEEVITMAADGAVSVHIICSLCRVSPWPCAILLDLRAWLEENERKRAIMRAERGKR